MGSPFSGEAPYCVSDKDLGHMADEKFSSPRTLFSEEIVDRIKTRDDALKALRKVKHTQPFRKGSTQRAGQSGHRDNQAYSSRQPKFKGKITPKGASRTKKGGGASRTKKKGGGHLEQKKGGGI